MGIPSISVSQQSDRPSSLLPDIDPQHIEIRGDFEVRFSGLSRQPILGFNPRPPVYRIDPDRMPFLESDEEIVASIPLSQLEPALKPEQRFITFAERRNGYVEGGLGSFSSPELLALYEAPIRDNESIAAHFSFLSSDGDRDFSSYRDVDTGLQWSRTAERNRWGLGLNASSAFNYSPEPEPLGSYTLSGTLTPGMFVLSGPQKLEHQSFSLEGRWQQLQHAWRGWQSSLSLHHFSNDGRFLWDERAETEENRYRFYLNRFWEGRLMEQAFGLQFYSAGSSYDTGIDYSQYWLTNSFAARYHHIFNHIHRFEARLQFFQLYDPVNEHDLFLYPDLLYNFLGTGFLSASIRVRGFVNDPSLESLFDNNRFVIQSGKELQHERGLHVHLRGGAELRPEIKVYSGVHYWQYYQKGYFSRNIEPEIPYYAFYYIDDATHLQWYGGAESVWPVWGISLMAEVAVNYSSVSKNDIPSGEIPYVPVWEGSVTFKAQPAERLSLSAWLNLSGKRSTYLADSTVSGYTVAGARVDFRINRHFSLYGKSRNILDSNYEIWQNYIERPFQVYGGLTFIW
ncbi:hypothetical protein QLX67_09105 [Balneolaceae bacterium ANBcel3]|nr:hypothetical protein [Balneolaceae bacterium ANBcel3]